MLWGQQIKRLEPEHNAIMTDYAIRTVKDAERFTMEDFVQSLEKAVEVYNVFGDLMEGYDAIAQYFSGEQTNKGLEGITWNHATGSIFVMKEGNPGLLIEVTADLKQIKRYHLLNEENGFCDPKVAADDLDFSGLCYDQSRDCFWVISDKGQRWFLYDWNRNQVIQSAKLEYERKGKERTIEKAEGVAIAPDTQRLYIVSDEEIRLYVFEICEGK